MIRSLFRDSLRLVFIAFSLLFTRAVLGQTTAFNYQGVINDSGAAANGPYDFHIVLFDASTNGVQLGANYFFSTAVSNGLFSLNLDFGATVFTDADRWLEIQIRGGAGGPEFTVLSPRQKVLSTPYAITARGLTGPLPSGGLSGVYSSPLTLNNSANVFSGRFSGDGSGLTNISVPGLSPGAYVMKTGDIMSGNLGFGQTAREMLSFYDDGRLLYAMGVQADTLYQRSPGNFAWYANGGWAQGQFDPGTGGSRLMTLRADAELHLNGPGAGVSLESRSVSGFVTNPTLGERWELYADRGAGAASSTFRLWSGGDLLTVDLSGNASVIGMLTAAGGLWGGSGASSSGVVGANGPGVRPDITVGVYGESTLSNGTGVEGVADTGDKAYGIWGRSLFGYAGWFDGPVQVNGRGSGSPSGALVVDAPSGDAVVASSHSSGSSGVNASSSAADGIAITATASDPTGTAVVGVSGPQSLFNGESVGVFGGSAAGTGVAGESVAANGIGVSGVANIGANAKAVFGHSDQGFAGFFEGAVNLNGAVDIGGQSTFESGAWFKSGAAFNGDVSLTNSFLEVRNVYGQSLDYTTINGGNINLVSNPGGSATIASAAIFTVDIVPVPPYTEYKGELIVQSHGVQSMINFALGDQAGTGVGIIGGDRGGMLLDGGGLTVQGTITPLSDRHAKTGFAEINSREILDRVARLPVTTWAYTNSVSVRHIGPVAQDFQAAFNVGADDRHISTTDEGGVALAAIQGLNQKVDDTTRARDVEIQALREKAAHVDDLEKSVAELKAIVQALVQKASGGDR
jgi:hypothetical protein